MNHLRHYLSRFKPTYWLALVYMLQASEYDISDYLKWFHRTSNFDAIEHRKRLVMTPKAVTLFTYSGVTQVFAWCTGALGIYRGVVHHDWLLFGFNIVATIASPVLTAYSVLIPVIAFKLILTNPRELALAEAARSWIKGHNKIVKIAVAGNVGVEEFCRQLEQILSAKLRVVSSDANVESPLQVSDLVAVLSGDEDVVILQLGRPRPGNIRRLSQIIDPDIGVVTGVSEAHPTQFKAADSVANAIFELGDHMAEKPLYVNGQSKIASERVVAGYPYLYTEAGCHDWKASASGKNDGIVAVSGSRKVQVDSGPGKLRLAPMLAMIDIAASLGLSDIEIEAGIAKTNQDSQTKG